MPNLPAWFALLATRFWYGFIVGTVFWCLVWIAREIWRGKDDQ